MRIGVDATSLIGHRTGIGNTTHHYIVRLANERNELVPFALTWSGRKQFANDITAEFAANKNARITVPKLPMAARPLRMSWQRFQHPAIGLWTKDIDVVWGPNFVVPPTKKAAQVVTVHDLTCIHFPQMCTTDVLQIPELLRKAISRGAWVHTVSEFVANDVRNNFAIDPQKVVAIPNGGPAPVALNDVAPLAARGRQLVGSSPYLLFVGTIEPRKDVVSLIAAFNLLAAKEKELQLVLVGPDGWGAQEVSAAINTSPFRSRIQRLGWVSDEQKELLMAGANAFVYPSVFEGFGLPVLEALSLHTPVVTTRIDAMLEVLGDAAVFADVGDAESLAAAINTVLTDDVIAKDAVFKGQARLAQFQWDESARRLEDLFQLAIESR